MKGIAISLTLFCQLSCQRLPITTSPWCSFRGARPPSRSPYRCINALLQAHYIRSDIFEQDISKTDAVNWLRGDTTTILCQGLKSRPTGRSRILPASFLRLSTRRLLDTYWPDQYSLQALTKVPISEFSLKGNLPHFVQGPNSLRASTAGRAEQELHHRICPCRATITSQTVHLLPRLATTKTRGRALRPRLHSPQ